MALVLPTLAFAPHLGAHPAAIADVFLAAVSPRSGLTPVAADSVANFTAPDGQRVEVIVKAPVGLMANVQCAPPQCLRMRAIAPGESPDDYFPAAVAAAQAAHVARLVVPRGTYDFHGPALSRDRRDEHTCNAAHYGNCAAHWTIGRYPKGPMREPDAVIDLDIDLSGSRLNFAAPTTGIWIVNAARVRLENFSIDWPSLQIASLGTIVQDPDNPGHRALVLDAAYPADDGLSGGAVQIQAVDPWDDSTDPALSPGRFDLATTNRHETYFTFGAPQPKYLGKTRAGLQTFSCVSCKFVNATGEPGCSMFKGCANFDGFQAGERVLVRHYTYNGFALLVNWSADIDLERIDILTGPGMGIAVQNAAGFRGLRVADSRITRGPHRLISTASDAINVSAFGGDILIERNEIAYQGDDGINVSPSPQDFTVRDARDIIVTGNCTPNPRDLAVAGDVLAFFDASHGLGSARVGAVTGSPCGEHGAAISLSCASPSECNTLFNVSKPGASFVDLTEQPVARYLIRANHLHENRGQGAQIGAPYGLITGNTFFRNSMGAIDLDADSLAAHSVVVTGNTVR